MGDIKWLDEAQAVINEIKPFVEELFISSRQPNTETMVLLNLKTYENDKFCIKLCASGFGVVGSDYDLEDIKDIKWFETPYGLLAEISSSYIERFERSLAQKLKNFEEA